MKNKLLLISSLFGAISVALGALAAHKLRGMLEIDSLDAFDKGVRYQMYHTLLLFALAVSYKSEKAVKPIAYLLIAGICCFSFSIYLLSTQSITGIKFSFLGPVTPIGGLLLISAWLMIGIKAKELFNDN